MKTPTLLAVLAAVATSAAAAQTVNFDNTEAGKLPPHWTSTKTGTGEPKWTVATDDSASSKPNVLKQSGVATYLSCGEGFIDVRTFVLIWR